MKKAKVPGKMAGPGQKPPAIKSKSATGKQRSSHSPQAGVGKLNSGSTRGQKVVGMVKGGTVTKQPVIGKVDKGGSKDQRVVGVINKRGRLK